MLTTLLTILLGALLLYAVWPFREGIEEYPDDVANSPNVLAKRNEANLLDLEKRMDLLNTLKDQVASIKTMSDSNTENINSLIEQCKN